MPAPGLSDKRERSRPLGPVMQRDLICIGLHMPPDIMYNA